MSETTRPRVGVSACLLGERVRHDGRHKHAPDLIAALSARFELLPVCPEAELGMGVPREPVHLEGDAGAPRMLGNDSLRDWTDAMREWARGRVQTLIDAGLHGFVLKADSPSCGIRAVPIERTDGTHTRGRGLFVTALLAVCPDLPIADETELIADAALAAFSARITAYRSGSPARDPTERRSDRPGRDRHSA